MSHAADDQSETTNIRKTAILIVGMHRSGTSAMARVASLCGATLPARLMPPNLDNVAGFWEPARIADLNDHLLHRLGLSWDDVRETDLSVLGAVDLEEIERRLTECLREDFGDAQQIVLKEPRISRLLPLYERTLRALGYRVAAVVMFRNPLAVIASLRARNGFDDAYAAQLWQRYVVEAEVGTRTLTRVFVDFESLLRDWRSVVASISGGLQLGWDASNEATAGAIDDFLNADSRHHVFADEEVGARSDLDPQLTQPVESLRLFEADARSPEATNLMNATADRLSNVSRVYAAIFMPELIRRSIMASKYADNREDMLDQIAMLEADRAELDVRLTSEKNQILAATAELEKAKAAESARAEVLERKLNSSKRLATSQGRSAFWFRNEAEQLRNQNFSLIQNVEANQSRIYALSSTLNHYYVVLSTTTAQLNAIEESTSWRLTGPLRRMASEWPAPLRRHCRRAAELAYWLVTPWKRRQPPEYLRQHRNAPAQIVNSPEASAAQTSLPAHDRFSLAHLPPAERQAEWPVIEWYDDEAPEVSIIVLNWNRSEMTSRCLDYIFQHTRDVTYEVVIVDNGSASEDVDRLRQMCGPARLIPIGINRYFGEANNIGAEQARGKYICLLNNDAFVHDGWLLPLLNLLRSNPTIGAVGPKFLYPDGSLQEAGALVQPDGFAVQLGKGDDVNRYTYETDRRVDYVSAACCLMKRSTFMNVLGFDLMYDPAYYEDVDLCLKVRLTGLSTWYCASSTVTHIENATSVGTKNNLELGSVVEINRAKFVARWGDYLSGKKNTAPAVISTNEAATRTILSQRSVAIYTPYNLTPGGGERFLLTIAEAFREQNFNVTLITPYIFSKIRILTMGRELGIKLDHLNLMTLENAVNLKPDHLYIIGNEITPPIRGFGTRNTYICQFPFPIQNPEYLLQTRSNWHAIDDFVCYSEFVRLEICKAAILEDLSEKPIRILAAPVPQVEIVAEKIRNRILHVGRFFAGGHSKRQDILIDTAKRLIDEGADVNLDFAGSLHPEPEHRAYYADLVERASGYPIYFHVNCSPEQLTHLYSSAGIYWHATGYGVDPDQFPERMEHFGISIIEAMSAGCIPIVYGAGGPKDIVRNGDTGYHFQTKEELFDRTYTILKLDNATFDLMAQRSKIEAVQYSSENFRQMVREFSRLS